MLNIYTTFFDLDKIAESGQCFRWKKTGEQAYEIPAYGKTLNIRQEGDHLYLDCTQAEYDEIWRDYFDLASDYGQYEQELRTRHSLSVASFMTRFLFLFMKIAKSTESLTACPIRSHGRTSPTTRRHGLVSARERAGI